MALPLNVFKTVNSVATGSPVGIYTAPVGYSAVILMAQAANTSDTTAHTITFSHKRSSTTTELMKSTAIEANDSLGLLSGKLVLETGDSIELSASDADIKVTISILETLN